MTIHLTYTYLWVLLGVVWLIGVATLNALGVLFWQDRVIIWTWPVSIPLLFLYRFGKEMLWP